MFQGQYGKDKVLTYPNYSSLVTLLARSLGPYHWGTFRNDRYLGKHPVEFGDLGAKTGPVLTHGVTTGSRGLFIAFRRLSNPRNT